MAKNKKHTDFTVTLICILSFSLNVTMKTHREPFFTLGIRTKKNVTV